MKTQVTKVTVSSTSPIKEEVKASAEVQKKEETKVEVAPVAAKTEVKKLSFIEKIKELLSSGDYDGGYAEAVPGVPGTEEAKPTNEPEGTPASPATPTNYTEKKAEEDHEEPDEDDMCECSACQGTGKVKRMKKAEEEEEKKTEEEELTPKMEEGEVKPPTKSEEEGKYDGGYAKSAKLPTVEEFRKMCSMASPTTPKGMSEWTKVCEEMANSTGPFEIRK